MKIVDGQKLIAALISGANAMKNNSDRVDAMNVFPVPDGDTGSNMSASIDEAVNEIKSLKTNSVSEVLEKFARGLLLGARGNSGVILSQIFKGFFIGLKDKNQASVSDLVKAIEVASKYAYKSVMRPVEGTILTVIRLTSENLNKKIDDKASIKDFFVQCASLARKACDETPKFLDVLKEVGVTDSGGEGLYVIFDGMASYFNNKPVQATAKKPIASETFLMEGEIFNGEFGYCTEFIVELKNHKSFKKSKFEDALKKMGNSIIVVHDEDILKVHLHTKKPGNVFNFGQKFGEFIKIKSENMTLQANESKSAKQSVANTNSSKKIPIGIISCNAGAGLIDQMQELKADFIIEAGQSSNPSAQDFINAINSLNTDKIILLPNNKNIILVAQQVAQTTNKQVIVVPTKTQVEGVVAMMNFDSTADLHANQEMMEDAIGEVKTGQVAKASKTTKIDGVSVTAGEYLAIAEHKIIKSCKQKNQAAKTIVKELINKDTEIITIYFGEDSTAADTEEIVSFIESNFEVEVEVKNGKQPIYSFLLAFE